MVTQCRITNGKKIILVKNYQITKSGLFKNSSDLVFLQKYHITSEICTNILSELGLQSVLFHCVTT